MRPDSRNMPGLQHGLSSVYPAMCFVLMFWLVSPTYGAIPAELVSSNFESQAIRLVSIEQNFVSYFDSDRNLQQVPLDEFMLIRFPQTTARVGSGQPDTQDQPATLISKDGEVHWQRGERRIPWVEAAKPPLNEPGLFEPIDAVRDEDVRRRAEELKRRIAQLEARLDMEDLAAIEMNQGTESPGVQLPEEKDLPFFNPVLATAYLTDGQIIHGRWVGMEDSGQLVVWRHPLLGQRRISLDQIRLIMLRHKILDESIRLPTGINDAVIFQNGDRLEGFIQSVNAEGVQLLPDGATQAITLELNACQRLEIGNPLSLPTEAPYRLQLRDGSVVDCRDVTLRQGQWIVEPMLEKSLSSVAMLPIDARFVSALQIMSSGFVMVPLWQLPLEPAESSVFGLSIPVDVNSRSIVMNAPLRWSWELPVGTRKLSMIARGANSDWSDVELNVKASGVDAPMVSRRLNAEKSEALIQVDLDKRDVVLELDAATNGPIMDQVELLNAFIVIERP